MSFSEGFFHITDWEGYDHMLFLIALCSGFSFREWKPVVLLVTAFTIGHCITLVIAGLDLIRINPGLVEFIIPCTIAATALFNLITWRKSHHRPKPFVYVMTVFFGLIHGLGFSSYFRMVSSEGNLVTDLLFFNLGVEAGQVIIVIIILFIQMTATRGARISASGWKGVTSFLALVASVWLMKETWPG